MRTWARITARTAVLTAGFAALGVTVLSPGAFADTSGKAPSDTGQASPRGAGTGGQAGAPVSAPVNACGRSVAIFGTADGDCPSGTAVPRRGRGPAGGLKTSGGRGIGSGDQVHAPVSAPVSACGNAVAIFGSAKAGCAGGASVRNGSGDVTTGRNGVIAGNQVSAPVSVPVSVCGNSVAILGQAVSACEGGAEVVNGAGQTTSGASGLGTGNQAAAPVSTPVSVCGNAVGHAMVDCDGGATVRNGGQVSEADSSVLSGNQAHLPVRAPASVCGDGAAVLGEAGAFCDGGAHVRGGPGPRTSNTGTIASGNQLNAPSDAPSAVCGNIITGPHHGATACEGAVIAQGEQGPRSSGDSVAGSGNQANAPVRAPSSVCGNAGAVTGHPEPVCEDGAGLRSPAARQLSGGTDPGRLVVTEGGRPVVTDRGRTVVTEGGDPSGIALGPLPAAGKSEIPVTHRAAGDPLVNLERSVPVRNVQTEVGVPAGIGQSVREGAVWALGLVAGVLALLRRLG